MLVWCLSVYFTNMIVEIFQCLTLTFFQWTGKESKESANSTILTFDTELKIMAIHLVKNKD